MPLKLYPPIGSRQTSWRIRGTYLGRRVERSARTGKRNLAQKVLKAIERQIERGEFSEPGEPTFASAAAAYMKAGGERTYLRKLLEHFGDKALNQIDQEAVDGAAGALYPNASGATRNRQVYTPVCAVLRRVGRRLDLRRPIGSMGAQATAWLWPEQFEALLAEAEKLNPEFATLLIVLFYTGMRLSEALGLEWERVRLQESFAYLPDTKNGQPRAIFLPPVVIAAIANLDQKRERVFRFAKGGHLYSLLKTAAFKAGINLPQRTAFHIARHTHASWLMRYVGMNTKQLVATGLWRDTKSAERYAHTVVTEEAMKSALLPTPRKRPA